MMYRCPGPCCGPTAWPHRLCLECRSLAGGPVHLPLPAKVPTVRVDWTPELIARLIADYETGTGASGLAVTYGASTQTILNRLREAGVAIRPRPGWRAA